MTREANASRHAPQPAADLPPANRRIRLPAFTLGGALTAEQRDFLDTHGFIRFRGFAGRVYERPLGGNR